MMAAVCSRDIYIILDLSSSLKFMVYIGAGNSYVLRLIVDYIQGLFHII